MLVPSTFTGWYKKTMITRARPIAIRRSRVQTRISCRKTGWERDGASPDVSRVLDSKGRVVALGASPWGEEMLFSSGVGISYCLSFIPCAVKIRPQANCKIEADRTIAVGFEPHIFPLHGFHETRAQVASSKAGANQWRFRRTALIFESESRKR